jgi:glycosyltransferase involved in cell wall biosynthesis
MDNSIGSARPKAMAKYLPQNGIEVSILTYRAQNEEITFNGRVVGVKDITRDTVQLPIYYFWRIWQKGLRFLGFYRVPFEYWRKTVLRNADKIIRYIKPDVILVSYPTIEVLEVGVYFAEKYKLPLISDFRDGLLFESIEVKNLKHTVTRRQYEILEGKVAKLAHLILTVSEPLSAYFRERYFHSNVFTLHNGFDPDDIMADMAVVLNSDIINIVHTGRIELSDADNRAIEVLSTALAMLILQVPDILLKCQFHFMGQYSKREVQLLAPFVKKNFVKLWGNQSRAKALGLQSQADVLLLSTAPDKTTIATGKLFEYLCANKPILALTRGTEAERIILKTDAGFIVAPDEPEAIVNAVCQIVNKQMLSQYKRNESNILEFDRSRQMRSLAQKIKGIDF